MKGAGVEVKQSLRLTRHPACKGAGWASDRSVSASFAKDTGAFEGDD